MPSKTARQRRAAGAELGRRRSGKKRRTFKKLPTKKLRHYAKKKAR